MSKEKDPFQPLSAKSGRTGYAGGGREMSPGRARQAEGGRVATRLRHLRDWKQQQKTAKGVKG